MNDPIKMLFVDNPYIAEQVYEFCKTLPEFREAERAYQQMEELICGLLGDETFNTFEQAQSWYMAKLVNAYYLFGLGLRQEVLAALQPKVS